MQTCVSELMKCSIEWASFHYGLYGCTIIYLTSPCGATPKLGCLPASSVIDTDATGGKILQLRLNALGQTSHSSAMHSSGPWVLQPLCTSGSCLQNRKQQDLPHEDAVRTNVVSVAHLEHSSCSKMPSIVIICFMYYMG